MVHIWKIFHLDIYFICNENVSTNVLFSSYNFFLDIFIIVSRLQVSDLGEYFNSHFNKFYPFSFVFDRVN